MIYTANEIAEAIYPEIRARLKCLICNNHVQPTMQWPTRCFKDGTLNEDAR